METAVALCAVGAERVVSNELRKLALPVAEAEFGRVRFQAEPEGLYRALMALRAADRVLLETAVFPGEDFDALFEGTREVPWERYIPRDFALRVVKVRTSRSRLAALTSIQAVVHKAAADRLCKAYKLDRLPEDGKTAELRVYIEKNRVSLLLDLSGEPLFKRGYRTEGGIAPLRETTAAAILLLSGWRRKFPLRDPFCGSGTLVIEAALYAWDMAPGLGRSFALTDLLPGDAGIEGKVREELWGKVDFSRTVRILGSDADTRAVSQARSNLSRAYALARRQLPRQGMGTLLPDGPVPASSLPELQVLPMEQARASGGDPGFIITNPPYGKRLGDPESAEGIYRDMGELARHFPGWKLGVITDHPGFESFFGKKADTCREITNGAVASYLFLYELPESGF
jgi:putative N6-adenine-specific DNA methylase